MKKQIGALALLLVLLLTFAACGAESEEAGDVEYVAEPAATGTRSPFSAPAADIASRTSTA